MWPLLLIFGIAWLIYKISESEPRRPELPAPKPPMRLLTAVATNVTVRDVVGDIAHPKTLCQIAITPGQEVFTPPLPAGSLRFIFQGASALKQAAYTQWYGMDVCYMTDQHHNYLRRHHCLLLNGKEVYTDPLEADRAIHRYAFDFESRGGRVGILLKWPFPYPDTNATAGVIDLLVTWCSPLDSPAQVAERKRREERNKRGLELAALAHLESNFLDPEYQKNYAASHVPRILHHDSQEWLAAYKEVVGDPDLCALIEAEHPHVMQFLEARLEVVRIAQRLAVEPTPEPPSPSEPKPKRKKTLDEVLAGIERHRRRELNKKRVKADDYKASIMQDLEILQEFIENLDNYPLDEDERERLIQEFKERLLGGEEDSSNGFRQLG